MLKFRSINIIGLCLFGIVMIFGFSKEISFWWLWLIFILWLFFTVVGSFHIRWNYHLSALHKVKNEKGNKIAITFDDGPNPQFTPQVLKLLETFDAKATFFCIGKEVDNFPEIVKQIHREGHLVGNHTYSHSTSLGFFSSEKIVEEINKASKSIQTAVGETPKLFRPPFGVTNPHISKAVEELGVQTIGWSVRSLDTTSRDEKAVFERIKNRIKKGDVILLHDTSEKSLKVLEQLLITLQNREMKAVTIADLFNLKAYE